MKILEYLRAQESESFINLELKEDNNDPRAVAVSLTSSDSLNEIRNKVLIELPKYNWWLKEYWQQKEMPQEQFDVYVSDSLEFSIYNFCIPLSDGHVGSIRMTLEKFSGIDNGGVLKHVRFILIDNEQGANPYTGEPINGSAANGKDGSIKLYPNAFRNIPHRVPGVSNIVGTLIHELSHSINQEIRNQWAASFGWRKLSEPKKMSGGRETDEETNEPKRCVTDYATVNHKEDLCESMVAALENPAVLDPSKMEFIEKRILQSNIKEPKEYTVELKKVDVSFPKVPNPIIFKRKVAQP